MHHLGATFMTVFLFTLICERGTPMNSGNRLLPFLHTYWIGQLMQFPTTIFCKWRVLYYLPLKLRALWKIFFHPEKYKKKFQTDLVTLSTYLIYPTSRIPNLYWIQKPFVVKYVNRNLNSFLMTQTTCEYLSCCSFSFLLSLATTFLSE